ncbi:MAG: CBS domain-containing protein [Chloroflexota bacterium]
MRSSVRIATISGIDIGVHYSWILVFLIVAWTLAVGFFPFQFPGLGATVYWVMGFLASLLLFVSVLIHELAHSFVAQARGLRVSSITLFIFGGVSNITGEPTSAGDELLISIVGPISSLVLAGLFWGIWVAIGDGTGPLEGVLLYLAGINVLLAVFNLIPGFPLDGGRVFRAIVWWVTGSFQTATRVAVAAGHVVAFIFILGGLFIAFSGAFLSGIWLILIGWFLNNAAEASGRQTREMEWFRGVRVRQVMNPAPTTVEPGLALSEVVHGYVLQRAVRALPVVDAERRLVGMVTLNEIRQVPRDRWEETPVAVAMTRAEDLRTVRPEDELTDALRILAEHDINQLPVVDSGRLVGLLSRSNMIRFLQIREELGVEGAEEERRRAA